MPADQLILAKMSIVKQIAQNYRQMLGAEEQTVLAKTKLCLGMSLTKWQIAKMYPKCKFIKTNQ